MESKCELKKTEEYEECKVKLAKVFGELLCNTSKDNIIDVIEKGILKHKKIAS